MIKKWDNKIFFKLYNFTVSHKKIAEFAVLFTNYSSKFFSMIYFAAAVYLIYYSDSRIRVFILIPAAVYLTAKLIPLLYNRRRPFAEYSLKGLVKQRKDHSFPSTHSSSSMIISLAVLNINFLLGVLMILLAALTALSRIMVGVHYPTDILGAWLLSLIFHFVGMDTLIL
jgi:undecaprenyl-diphosphatase